MVHLFQSSSTLMALWVPIIGRFRREGVKGSGREGSSELQGEDDLVREHLTGERRPPGRIWDDALLAVIDGEIGKRELPI